MKPNYGFHMISPIFWGDFRKSPLKTGSVFFCSEAAPPRREESGRAAQGWNRAWHQKKAWQAQGYHLQPAGVFDAFFLHHERKWRIALKFGCLGVFSSVARLGVFLFGKWKCLKAICHGRLRHLEIFNMPSFRAGKTLEFHDRGFQTWFASLFCL